MRLMVCEKYAFNGILVCRIKHILLQVELRSALAA